LHNQEEDDKPFASHTVFFIFEVPTQPSTMYVKYERVSVQPYIPNPVGFFCVRGLGTHNSGVCVCSIVYGMCSENRHGESPYSIPSHCIICCGGHASNDETCPVYLSKKFVQELRAKESLSFLEARKRFLES
jgi:hypothetical protein